MEESVTSATSAASNKSIADQEEPIDMRRDENAGCDYSVTSAVPTTTTRSSPDVDEITKEKKDSAGGESSGNGCNMLANPQFWMLVAMNLAQNCSADAKVSSISPTTVTADTREESTCRVKPDQPIAVEQKPSTSTSTSTAPPLALALAPSTPGCGSGSTSSSSNNSHSQVTTTSGRWATAHVATAWMIWQHQQTQKQLSGTRTSCMGSSSDAIGHSRKAKDLISKDYPRPRTRTSRHHHKDREASAAATAGQQQQQQIAFSALPNAMLNEQMMMMAAKAAGRMQPVTYPFYNTVNSFGRQAPMANYADMARLLNLAGLFRYTT